MKDTDVITTVLGGIGAVATAATPVINSVTPGTSMHSQDWIQLAMAAVFALMGFFTNKKGTTNA